jgi:hypothetical protein
MTQVDSIKIDSLSTVPASIHIQLVDTNNYTFDAPTSTLVWKKKPTSDSVKINYRVFPFDFAKVYHHKNPKLIEQNLIVSPFEYYGNQANQNEPFIDFGNVDYAGSFARNLSFGNGQDVVLNSQFNMQLDGNLGDSIILTGAITDNTIPFQPEGNTQQIQEFDRVFIQIRKKANSFIIGDHDIKKPNSYFMNFYKRVQGALVSTSIKTGKQGENKMSLGASLAKGKFVRNTLIALEGNQGPYKLTGSNGEQFFIVLAGTERVFIDGVQMNRGENQDYIIDYNTAEISFMPKRIITKDLRIVVEFEFSDRNYLNSFIYFNNEWQANPSLQFRFNAYSNQDAKNQSIQQTLDSTQKRFLGQLGDSIQKAFYPSVRLEDSFRVNKILYQKKDSIIQGAIYSNVYVYSTNVDSARYTLNFSFVGQGKGNYRQSISNANGRVYQWIVPIGGFLQGDYEPVVVLVTPKKQQLFTLGSTYQIDARKVLQVEAALSNADPNLFSKIDNQTHLGLATKIIYDETRVISDSNEISLNNKLSYEFVQSRFRPIERFRNVEFLRDWNATINTSFEDEHLGNASFLIKKNKIGSLAYQFDFYARGKDFIGQQHTSSLLFQKNGFRALLKGSVLNQHGKSTKSIFFRPIVELEKQFSSLKNISLGTKNFADYNELKDLQADTLLRNAFAFNVANFYVKTNPNAQNNFIFDYTWRQDKVASNNKFKQSTLGQTFSLNASLTSFEHQEVKITSSFRILNISDSTLTALKPDESLLGRVEYNVTAIRGFMTANVLYELGSGQELKREFAYIEVPIGQGLYVWRDYNNDEVQQLNEFEIAIFPNEKKFIRILTPTNQYVKAKYSIYNQTITLNPKAILTNSQLKGFAKFFSLFYVQSAIQTNNRFIGNSGLSQYNPLAHLKQDSLMLNSASSMINSFLFNRFGNVWGIDYVQTFVRGKTLLTYGVDTRKNMEHQLRTRLNATSKFTFTALLKLGKRSNESKFLESKSYSITQKLFEPGYIWLLSKNQLRFQGSYKFDMRANVIPYGNEMSKASSMNMQMKYNTLGSGSFNFSTTFSNIAFNGDANSAVGYSMLDGLVGGKNWLWQISFEKRLAKNIEMSLEYEGRKSGTNNVIQTGRASLRAVF